MEKTYSCTKTAQNSCFVKKILKTEIHDTLRYNYKFKYQIIFYQIWFTSIQLIKHSCWQCTQSKERNVFLIYMLICLFLFLFLFFFFFLKNKQTVKQYGQVIQNITKDKNYLVSDYPSYLRYQNCAFKF